MERILFMGMPGAGKGTQAALLKEKGFYILCTGDIIREGFQNNNSLLKPYQEHIDNGGYLQNEIIFQLIEQAISKFPEDAKGYILDGAVRTIEQAKFVKKHSLADKVIFFTLTEEQAEGRLLNRNQGRADDAPEAIKNRFIIYKEKTQPILDYLKENFEFYEVDASPTIGEIHKEVFDVIYNK
ncbi:nucleoside monophosphate kinase [archaeon]|jgi:adenylate kinase|nr:nucleoside monophosphate kinase [archaeon]